MTIAITKGRAGDGVWCDRSSVLGNPFHLINESQRNAVCDAYQEYFHLVVDLGYSLNNAAWTAHDRFGLPISGKWKPCDRAQFLAELDRLSSILATTDRLTLKCWCINAEIKSRADLAQKKRCHCLTIAGYLLPEVGSFAKQLTLEV